MLLLFSRFISTLEQLFREWHLAQNQFHIPTELDEGKTEQTTQQTTKSSIITVGERQFKITVHQPSESIGSSPMRPSAFHLPSRFVTSRTHIHEVSIQFGISSFVVAEVQGNDTQITQSEGAMILSGMTAAAAECQWYTKTNIIKHTGAREENHETN